MDKRVMVMLGLILSLCGCQEAEEEGSEMERMVVQDEEEDGNWIIEDKKMVTENDPIPQEIIILERGEPTEIR